MKIFFLLLAVMWTLGGCGVPAQTENAGYQQITAEEAKELMDVWKYEIILDVREQDEYDEKHIHVGSIISKLLELGNISNMEISSTSLENVIFEIYTDTN